VNPTKLFLRIPMSKECQRGWSCQKCNDNYVETNCHNVEQDEIYSFEESSLEESERGCCTLTGLCMNTATACLTSGAIPRKVGWRKAKEKSSLNPKALHCLLPVSNCPENNTWERRHPCLQFRNRAHHYV
jgi:hypothetical protein